jgi:hypothetical protein
MKRDIRDLFKEEDDFKSLPVNHRTEFLERLKKQPDKKSTNFPWLKIAAVLLVALTAGLNIFYDTPDEAEVSPIVAQIEMVETEYLKNIEAEWESFLSVAEDSMLVKRFENKLIELDTDYQEISLQFRQDSNDIFVVEDLINNLKKRLNLLKDIQSQIKLINQKNELHENSI